MRLSMKHMLFALLSVPVASFSIRPTGHYHLVSSSRRCTIRRAASDDDTAAATATSSNLLSLTLEKPLGLLLEEIEEGADKGVKVQELTEGGSASSSEYSDKLPGLQVASVMGDDVLNVNFDAVMSKIIEAPSPVSIEFVYEGAMEESQSAESEPQFEAGTTVTINVIQEGKDDMSIDAKVGDNLRKVLLANDVEVYRGLKKKLGNCNGNGQCTFCAVDFVESEGWADRSEYEDGKIGKWPRARLACLNNIQGPATIRVQ